MFTTKQFRCPSLHETISHLCLEKTSHGSYVTCMPVESTEMAIPCKNEHFFLVWWYRGARRFTYALTERLNNRDMDMAPERRTKRVIPGFRPVRSLLDAVGPSLLSDTDLSLGTALREKCRPLKPYETNPTPTHSSKPPLSIYRKNSIT